jgi:hypothetical protein
MKSDQINRLRSGPANPRREPGPFTRTYDSIGPDVRIRGTARHIAEKYLQLARDAHTASNAVAAENYLQHAEHYFRLIAAAQTGAHETGEEDMRDPAWERLPDRFALPVDRAPEQMALCLTPITPIAVATATARRIGPDGRH